MRRLLAEARGSRTQRCACLFHLDPPRVANSVPQSSTSETYLHCVDLLCSSPLALSRHSRVEPVARYCSIHLLPASSFPTVLHMTPHRPRTANDAGPSRMPLPSAEALLWGPEMKKQHAHLLTEMRALQKQHDSYDTRIRATETVAEAFEAVAARIGDLKERLVVIEANKDNEAFPEWACAEITRLNKFVDTNKNLVQKQSELDTKVSIVAESVARLLQDNVGIEDVLRRLDVLEHDRREDAERIQSLERDVRRLRSMQESDASCPMQSRTRREERKGNGDRVMLPRQLDVGISELTIGSDHDARLLSSLLPGASVQEEIQVPQSLEVQET